MLGTVEPKVTNGIGGELDIFEVFFLGLKKPDSLKELILNCLLKANNSFLGYGGCPVVHLVVRVNNSLYEVTLGRVHKIAWHPSFPKYYRVLGGYIYYQSPKQTEVLQKVLKRQIDNNQKLNLWECFVYLVNLKLNKPADIPFTCATLASVCLEVLFSDWQNLPDSHVPASVFSSLIVCQLTGKGAIWTNS